MERVIPEHVPEQPADPDEVMRTLPLPTDIRPLPAGPLYGDAVWGAEIEGRRYVGYADGSVDEMPAPGTAASQALDESLLRHAARLAKASK